MAIQFKTSPAHQFHQRLAVALPGQGREEGVLCHLVADQSAVGGGYGLSTQMGVARSVVAP